MALTPAQLGEIDAALATASADPQTIASLRQLAPGFAITRCDALDMRDETAFRIYASVALFLIDTRDHCWKITQDPARATGFVLAPREGAI
jgi:hypothetical protein